MSEKTYRIIMNCTSCGDKTVDYSSIIPTQHCNGCGLSYQIHNQNIKNNENLYHEDFWKERNVSEIIDSCFKNSEGKDLMHLWHSMYSYSKKYLQKKTEFLEIGAGTGNSLFMFEKHGYNVVGIEPDPKNTELINKKLKKGKCITGFIEEFSEQKEFDIIWMSHSLEHMVKPIEVLTKCFNLLKKGGVIFIAVPDCDNPEMREQSIKNDSHLWHFTKNSLKNLAIKTGYKVNKCNSLKLISTNERRLHTIIRKMNLSKISDLLLPYYPFKITEEKNGYEIRIILQKE